MKMISNELQAHLNGELTTCAELVRIIRQDGVVVGLTTHDRDILFAGVTYMSDGAYESGRLRQREGLKAEANRISGILDSAAIDAKDLHAGLYDHARVDVYLCNWMDLSQGALHLQRGWLGDVRYSEGSFVSDLRGFQDLLDRKVCETYTPECRFDLGSARCGVELAGLTVTGTVTGVWDALSFMDYTRSEPDGTFQDARLSWTSGANKGVSVEVRLWDGEAKRFALWVEMDKPIAVGDAYSVASGCDKRFATCKARFANGHRYGGFPHLPGLAKILAYPSARS